MAANQPKPPTEHAHQLPPESIRALHKHYQRASADALALDHRVLDFANPSDFHSKRLHVVGTLCKARLQQIFAAFESDANGLGKENEKECQGTDMAGGCTSNDIGDKLIYEHEFLPGLQIIPSLLSLSTQKALLLRLWIRALSDPLHQTNLHLHYDIPYPDAGVQSFFHYSDPEHVLLKPKDPDIHKPLSVAQMIKKKLRWMTLGGQYDWTRKVYPELDSRQPRNLPVPFPRDTAKLINSLFPNLNPQAAISNLYTPGDTLSPHRDISEASSAPLASISIGADAVFIIGLCGPTSENEGEDEKVLVLKIRSGDVLLMGGESRWAWHSVPKVLQTEAGVDTDTTIGQWPGAGDVTGVNEAWVGWMKNRRVNLNVRQMWD